MAGSPAGSGSSMSAASPRGGVSAASPKNGGGPPPPGASPFMPIALAGACFCLCPCTADCCQEVRKAAILPKQEGRLQALCASLFMPIVMCRFLLAVSAAPLRTSQHWVTAYELLQPILSQWMRHNSIRVGRLLPNMM